MADRPSEYIRFVDGSSNPSLTASWTLTSPDANVWAPTISTGGVITFTDGAAAVAGSIVFIGLDGLAWSPTISNGGIVTVTSGSALSSSDTAATLTDSSSISWTLYVDNDELVNVTTSFLLPALFRYPSVLVSWTPTADTDRCVIHSVRAMMTMRRRTS